MTKIVVGKDGRIELPETVSSKSWPEPGVTLVFEPDEHGIRLHFARPDARQAYIEVTTHCNLDCAMCIRQVWRDSFGLRL